MATLTITPIKPKLVSDQVFDQLRELIFRRQIKPGEPLLPERELSRMLNVSRSTVRNAINKLIGMGLVEQKKGLGAVVCAPGQARQNPIQNLLGLQEATIAEVIELWQNLESDAAQLAAVRASDEDIQAIEEAFEAQVFDCAEGSYVPDTSISFHMAVIFASKNRAKINLMKHLYDLLFGTLAKEFTQIYADPESLNRNLDDHREILDAIRKRDARRAYMACARHIGRFRERLAVAA
ncbi:MAG: FadR/GntR family transcriptional regulator [Desulfosarcinaceae bacterium]|nr:FadR/GntR family transcriptional regulator [Desulfosarcinaceae bacterium]